MDLSYKEYKIFFVSKLPEQIKDYFKKYNDSKTKYIGLFFDIGKKDSDNSISVYGELLTKSEELYSIHNYFIRFEEETIMIYYDEV
jgi:hypothetical protein